MNPQEKYKLVMIPSVKPTELYIGGGSSNLGHTEGYIDKKDGLNISQHIYIVSDENVKIGDHIYINQEQTNSVGTIIINEYRYGYYQCFTKGETHKFLIENCKKIIASTIKYLNLPFIDLAKSQWIIDWYNEKGELPEIELEMMCAQCHSMDKDECNSARECSDGNYNAIAIDYSNNSVIIKNPNNTLFFQSTEDIKPIQSFVTQTGCKHEYISFGVYDRVCNLCGCYEDNMEVPDRTDKELLEMITGRRKQSKIGLQIALTNYIKNKHTADECLGFSDGYEQCLKDNNLI